MRYLKDRYEVASYDLIQSAKAAGEYLSNHPGVFRFLLFCGAGAHAGHAFQAASIAESVGSGIASGAMISG